MHWKAWRDWFVAGSRILGVALLAGLLLAACGDDDDDDDADVLDPTSVIEATSPSGDEDAETTPEEATPTTADGEATESEDGMTATEDDAATTEEVDGSPTAGDVSGTATEEMDAGTATEDMAEGTATEEEDDATATEADDDVTATEEEDDGTATADDSDATPTEDDETDATATEETGDGDTAELGDTVELDGFSITVEAVEPFAGLPGFFEAEEGNELLGVMLTVENTDDADELSVLRALSTLHLEDDTGERYDVDLVATAILLFDQQGIMETQIEAGGEVTGAVGFQVPADAEGLMLVIESDEGQSTMIDLSDELQ